MEDCNLVFVYGTLKKGKYNSENMHGVFLCDCETAIRYPLIVTHGLPYLLERPNQGFHVKGELYGLRDQDLEALDLLEGVPFHYHREQIHVSAEIDNRPKLYLAWCYFSTYPHETVGMFLKEEY